MSSKAIMNRIAVCALLVAVILYFGSIAYSSARTPSLTMRASSAGFQRIGCAGHCAIYVKKIGGGALYLATSGADSASLEFVPDRND